MYIEGNLPFITECNTCLVISLILENQCKQSIVSSIDMKTYS